jgi:hypothetical protein
MKVADCKSRIDTDNLLASFYVKQNMDPMCRYITNRGSVLMFTRPFFDNAFTYDDGFTSKSEDCYSNITKEIEDVDNQRVDDILRNINDDNDYLSTEETPSFKGVKVI